jgi:hypothetical protein
MNELIVPFIHFINSFIHPFIHSIIHSLIRTINIVRLFSIDDNPADVTFPSPPATPSRVYRLPLSNITNQSRDGIRRSPKRRKLSSLSSSSASSASSSYVFDERDRCIDELMEQIVELTAERREHVKLIERLELLNEKVGRMAGQLHARVKAHIFIKRKQWKGKKRFCAVRRYPRLRSFIYSFIHLFIDLFIDSYIHSFIHSFMCRPYQNYNGVDLGSAFQFAFLIKNVQYASTKFNICETTFRRHYRTWTNLGQPFTYQIEENRGRDAKLTKQQCDKLYDIVCAMILKKEFVNDFIVRRLIGSNFKVDVSPSFIVDWKKRYKISSITPSYSRVAAFNPHSAWIERQFLRDVAKAFAEYDHDCIFNADETFCRTFPHTLCKVYGFTNTDREGRQVKVDTDTKQGITCMTTVTASGLCLPPYFVKKGSTTRCVNGIHALDIAATFSDSGWMNEAVAIQWIDTVLVPHLQGRPGCLIWDVFRAHLTDGVREHLNICNIKPIYVPASMTWKRQPLDTHIFAVLKKKYQAYYFDRVFAEKEQLKQLDTIWAYNQLMLNINKQHIVSAFKEAILMDAQKVPTIEDDPNPQPKEAMDVETSQTDQSEEPDEEIIVNQYEDEPVDESSGDEMPVEMPTMRRPRLAHNVAYDAQLAQVYQSNITR